MQARQDEAASAAARCMHPQAGKAPPSLTGCTGSFYDKERSPPSSVASAKLPGAARVARTEQL